MPLPPVSDTVHSIRVRSEHGFQAERILPEETPVAMVYNGTTYAVMMASPADVEDFAVGFTLTEGVVRHVDEIQSVEVIIHELGIEARIWLAEERAGILGERRRSMTGPVGCGLCGIDSLEQAVRDLPKLPAIHPEITVKEIAHATDQLRQLQPLHDQTRGVHAAGFLLPGKGVILACEDVGRHNALDKLIGAMARQRQDSGQGMFVLTSRVSVEMVQKSAMAGCSLIVAVSAPTLHALRIADAAGITVAAFARDGSFELFTHPERILIEVPDVA